jgi:hypothetical protein
MESRSHTGRQADGLLALSVRQKAAKVNSSRWPSVVSAQPKILQIIEAGLNGLERARVTAVLLNEDVLGAGLGRVSKDLHPVNAPLADRRERVGPTIVGEVAGARRKALLETLDMKQGKAPRVPAFPAE